jgi:hypothetical protein
MAKETGKMKIGIITYWTLRSDYGQLFQCYVLQRILRVYGQKAYLIRYNQWNSLDNYFIQWIKDVIKSLVAVVNP